MSEPEGMDSHVITLTRIKHTPMAGEVDLYIHFLDTSCIYSHMEYMCVLLKHKFGATHLQVLFLSILLRQLWPVTVSVLCYKTQFQGPFSSG